MQSQGLGHHGPLEWTERSENEHHAHRDKAHYIVYEVPNDPSERKWRLELFSMFTDEPGQIEERLGEFHHHTLTKAKSMAQGLADQRGRFW